MRFMILVAVLLISACASNATGQIKGNQEKSGWTAMDKYVDSDARYVQPDAARCRSGSVLYCTTKGGKSSCDCVLERNAEFRVERLLGTHQRGIIRSYERSRVRH